MNADELAQAASNAYLHLKVVNYIRETDEDAMMMLQFQTPAGHQIVGVVEGRRALVGAIEAARTSFGPIEAVIFNADARASRVRRPLDAEDSIIDCLITIVVKRDEPPAYRCFAYYETDDGLQFEQSEIEFDTIQDVVIDLNRSW